MRVLLTGMTSSQTREDNTIAGCLAQSLRAAGHEVVVDRPSLQRALDGETWEHVFVGLGPLHGIGTSMKYGALGTIGANWDRCTLYLDDVDSGKIGSGLRIMSKHRWKIIKPFYGYCREYEIASRPGVADWLLSIIDSLLAAPADEHPKMLVPAFTFDDAFKTAGKISGGAASNAVKVDWSSYAPKLREFCDDIVEKYGAPVEQTPDGHWWATERMPENAQVRSLGPFTWEVMQTVGRTLPVALEASGFLAPGSTWTPRFYQASQAGLPMVAPWRVFADAVGDSFEVLAGTIEVMSDDERQQLATYQLEQLNSFIQTREELAAIVGSLLETGEK